MIITDDDRKKIGAAKMALSRIATRMSMGKVEFIEAGAKRYTALELLAICQMLRDIEVTKHDS